MPKFRIMPHGRLQEWVAEEKGYFTAEGLEYEFVYDYSSGMQRHATAGNAEPSGVREVRQGAFESMQAGRACEVSSACHWAVNMAASSRHGRMWGHAYAVTPSGIYVPPESPVRTSQHLANVAVAVGFHSGSHFSALQALEKILPPSEITLQFVGRPLDRLALLLDRKVASANVFGVPMYILEQQGFRRIVDTTFMIGFLLSQQANEADVHRYFRALQRAQRDIDLEPERYKHYFLKGLPEQYHSMLDIHACGLGERLVFEPYTRESFEQTHRCIASWQIFDSTETPAGHADYTSAVVL
jgi:NitT/TauT family transport system substrate-binding protein